nr:Uncharacterised protein [Escherichia coli]
MTANPTRCARLVFAQSALCLAPRVQPRGQCHAQQLAPAVSAAASFLSAAVAAIPGGSGAVLRRRHRGPACYKRLSACGLRLKGFMPARRRLAAAARAAQKAARHSFPPRQLPLPAPVRVVMQRQTPVRQRCHRAPFRRLRTLCRPHPQTRAVAPPCRRRRLAAPPSRVAGNGLSGKRNDRFVAVVIW